MHPRLRLILSGVLLFLSFPPIGWWPLVFVALTPAFLALRGVGFWVGFRRGFLLGFTFWLFLWSWLIPFVNFWSKSNWLGIVPWVLLSIVLSLYFALFGGITGIVTQRTRWPLYLIFPSIWVLAEYLRSYWPLGGLPWALLGTSLYQSPLLIQPASLGGVWLLSFGIALFNVMLFSFRKMNRTELASFGIVIGMLFAYSLGWLTANPKHKIEVAVMQTGIDQAYYHRTQQIHGDIETTMLSMLSSLPPKTNNIPRIAIFPESVSPVDPYEVAEWRQALASHAKNADWIIFGSHRGNDKKYSNMVVLLAKDGSIADSYTKVRLVPFGEYVPYRNEIPFLSTFNVLELDATPGKTYNPLKAGSEAIGTPICFESLYPDVSRSMTLNGAQFFAFLINDDWFDRPTRWLHAMAAPIRAVETARPVVQVTPTGISMLITSNGRMNILPSGQVSHVETMSTNKYNRLTPYVRFGDWVIYGSALLLLGSITIGRKRKETAEDSEVSVNEV